MDESGDAARDRLRAPGSLGLVRLLLLGGLCGLAWSAGLRGFMAEVATVSRVEWAGTFGWILLPGVATGMLLAWAEHLRRDGGRPGWRWLACSPLLLAAVTLHRPWDLPRLFTEEPLGGGALGVALYGMAIGYALSGRGPRWGRLLAGIVASSAVPGWLLTVAGFGGPALAWSTPPGLWVALYFWSYLLLLGLASAIPHRPVANSPVPLRVPSSATAPGTGAAGAAGAT